MRVELGTYSIVNFLREKREITSTLGIPVGISGSGN